MMCVCLRLAGGLHSNCRLMGWKAITPHSDSSLSTSVDHIASFPQNQKLSPSSFSLLKEERKGPKRWRQEGKYLFCGHSVELQTSVCLLRKLSPTREQPEQTISHHAVWLAMDPRVFVCSDSRHDRRRNTGKEEMRRMREREKE